MGIDLALDDGEDICQREAGELLGIERLSHMPSLRLDQPIDLGLVLAELQAESC
ncbi:hypothetical protein D3C80_1929750 [compost metagenome]